MSRDGIDAGHPLCSLHQLQNIESGPMSDVTSLALYYPRWLAIENIHYLSCPLHK